ncbi:hypothetical protein MUG91_G15n56 [Manis pentadactyla]|nr:hypothetical protein MUG91_G15n56 [Manis pentadactyla]
MGLELFAEIPTEWRRSVSSYAPNDISGENLRRQGWEASLTLYVNGASPGRHPPCCVSLTFQTNISSLQTGRVFPKMFNSKGFWLNVT